MMKIQRLKDGRLRDAGTGKVLKRIGDIEIDAKAMIEEVYQKLKNRQINPSGKFDKAGRWYADKKDLINVREPSRDYPYSQLVAARSKKYVTAVYNKYKPKTVSELIKLV